MLLYGSSFSLKMRRPGLTRHLKRSLHLERRLQRRLLEHLLGPETR